LFKASPSCENANWQIKIDRILLMEDRERIKGGERRESKQ